MNYFKKCLPVFVFAFCLCGCSNQQSPPSMPMDSFASTQMPNEVTISESTTTQEETTIQGEKKVPLDELLSTEDFASYFTKYPVAVMLLSDGVSQITYNEQLSTERYSPCSTFKIVNSLIVLEEKVVSIEDSMRKWDGTHYEIPDFNRDQDMRSAMKYSCVWYYNQLAKEVGTTTMQNYLREIGYGNMDISGGIDAFWLDSSLLISPKEQLDFIVRFYNNDLPFSQENIEYVKSIMLQEGYPFELYGKTGSSSNGYGWFVGYAIFDDSPYFFVTYIEGEKINGSLVREKTTEILNRVLSNKTSTNELN
ncbi:MAG: class D beta-lactamase [Lachnospiraceae bacterium]|jgi:beta-lactamase class D|nr:class D beta-lactamase [Lachnospiraceae bacterium]